MRPEKHTGLSRLGRYTVGRRRRISLVMLIAAISAAAPVLGWMIVGDAIDNGIKASNATRLTVDVVLYIAVGLTAWILGTTTWLMLAGIGQRIVLDLRRDLFEHLTSLSLRYFSQQKAGWIIARLTSDVDAISDVLNQGLTTLVVNSLTLLAAIGGLFLLDWRLGVVALDRPAARDRRHPLVPDVVPRRVRRRAHADRSRHGPARRVRLGHGRRPGVQPRAGIPARVRRPERGEPGLERLRAEALVGLLPGDRVPRRGRGRDRPLRRSEADRRRLAPDRHADRRDRDAAARLPAAAGALGALRPGAGGERRDDQDLDRARRREGHHRPARRARDRSDRRSPAARQHRLRLRRRAGDPRDLDRRAAREAASRSSASRAAASRRPPS